jgi:hypothetical protein
MEADNEFFWETLLTLLDEGSVVPILGDELAVNDEGVRWHGELARILATELRIPPDELPERPTPNDVCSAYFRRGATRRTEIYTRLAMAAKRLEFKPSLALRQLASIRAFKLFVTTSYDPLIAQAIDAERFNGEACTEVLAFAPKGTPVDLAQSAKQLHRPVVFHLFGKLAATDSYAATEEDLIEFFHKLHSDAIRPKRLFDELRDSNLLLIGNAFPDWLARFLIRLAKSERILTERSKYEYLVATPHTDTKSLLSFLKSFSRETQFFEAHDPATFIAELQRRWQERHPETRDTASLSSHAVPDAPDTDATSMIDGALFLSYASENRSACLKLRNALDQAGIEVWFDREQLKGGDAWDQKIRRNIKHCSLILPLISRETVARREGYFRLEWRLARERAQRMATDRVFILPCLLDDSPEAKREAATEFPEIQHMKLYSGDADEESVQRIKSFYRAAQKREANG